MERRRIVKTEVENEEDEVTEEVAVAEEATPKKVEELELPGMKINPEPSVNDELKTKKAKIVLPEITDPDDEPQVRFRKIGGGTFRMASGRIIKPNQTFTAKASEIPQGMRKFVVPLTGGYEEIDSPKRIDLKYSLRVRSPGWYDIIDGEGKVINENALRALQAREMLKSLAG